MSTIIMNGSPKAEHGNTEIFIRRFIEGMQQPCDVCYVAKEDCNCLARRLQEYDKIIIAFPSLCSCHARDCKESA
jgi:multimeric flavodoxin WrbA